MKRAPKPTRDPIRFLLLLLVRLIERFLVAPRSLVDPPFLEQPIDLGLAPIEEVVGLIALER